MVNTMVKTVFWMVVACMAAGCVHEVDHDSQRMARLEGDRHVTIRAEAGRLWWSYYPWTEPHPLWAYPAQGRVQNIDVRPVLSKDDGFIVTFEQGGAVWEGEIGEGLVALELARRD